MGLHNSVMLDIFCGIGYGSYLISTKIEQSYLVGIDENSDAIAFSDKY